MRRLWRGMDAAATNARIGLGIARPAAALELAGCPTRDRATRAPRRFGSDGLPQLEGMLS